jgi:hemoglobin
MRDISSKDDIKTVVNAFYQKVRTNDLLSPVFTTRIPDEAWPAHLERMYNFWNAILFAERGFEGNPMQKHLRLPIDENHFTQWLFLFNQTIDEHFSGPKADEAKRKASSIARIMQYKIELLRN